LRSYVFFFPALVTFVDVLAVGCSGRIISNHFIAIQISWNFTLVFNKCKFTCLKSRISSVLERPTAKTFPKVTYAAQKITLDLIIIT
jgi:hypothetical protein